MGHKVHPNGFRLGVYRNWEAKWFAPDKEFKPLLLEDVRLRRMLMTRLKNAGVARIETERSSSALTITLHTAKPGIVIGKGGTSVDQLRDDLEKITGKRVRVTIQEIKKPELSAQLVAENVAAQLEKRIAFRRAIKQSLTKTMRTGAATRRRRVRSGIRARRYRGGPVRQVVARHPHDEGGDCGRRGYREAQARHPCQGGDHRHHRYPEGPACPAGDEKEGISHVAPSPRQISQAPSRPPDRRCHPGRRPGLRRVRPASLGSGLDDKPPDRGGPPRDDALRPSRWQGLHSRLPRQVGHQETGRDPHG